MDRIRAAERVVEAVDLLKALVPLLVDALALRHLVEHRRLWLGVVLHKLHVLENWEMEIDEVKTLHLYKLLPSVFVSYDLNCTE